MLTSDVYVFIFAFISPSIMSNVIDLFYVIGFFSILAGLVVFNIREPKDSIKKAKE